MHLKGIWTRITVVKISAWELDGPGSEITAVLLTGDELRAVKVRKRCVRVTRTGIWAESHG